MGVRIPPTRLDSGIGFHERRHCPTCTVRLMVRTLAFQAGSMGSIPIRCTRAARGPLTERIWCQLVKLEDVGSNPTRVAMSNGPRQDNVVPLLGGATDLAEYNTNKEPQELVSILLTVRDGLSKLRMDKRLGPPQVMAQGGLVQLFWLIPGEAIANSSPPFIAPEWVVEDEPF